MSARRRAPPPPAEPIKTPDCHCPRDHLGIRIHKETCLLFKNETLTYPNEVEECECGPATTRVCTCCQCSEDQCHCKDDVRRAFDGSLMDQVITVYDQGQEQMMGMAAFEAAARSREPCKCAAGTPRPGSPMKPECRCPRDHLDIAIHEETCLLFKNETLIYLHDVEECECPPISTRVCECCQCLEEQCRCKKAGREAFDEWRKNREVGAMPTVLETTHPLMKKFQESLRRFLERENELAQLEIVNLRDELQESKLGYEKELEAIYKSDHDTNGQRILIEEYESTLANERKTREEAEKAAQITYERYKTCKDKLDYDMRNQRDSKVEVDALSALVRQMEAWRDETESDLTVSQRMTEKMKQEKRVKADEKRQLDMVIYGLNNEVWKLEARMELFQKQMEIKNKEMNKAMDKVTAYGTELEDLELDKKRLISLMNSVLVNIGKRDNVHHSVREDYLTLQENYRTLTVNLNITKKGVETEIQKSKELSMNRDKLKYDLAAIEKNFEVEDAKREQMETQIAQIEEALEMSDRDQALIIMENKTLRNILSTTENECDRRAEIKLKMENEILQNLQDCLLNDKAVEAMANGIKKMREMSRKLEISLMAIECQHAKVMLDIEMYKARQGEVQAKLEKCLKTVRDREAKLDEMEESFEKNTTLIQSKQRELNVIQKKYHALKEVYDTKSPQDTRIIELESHIKELRDRTEGMQHDWMRLQGHVVRLTTTHQRLTYDISLINKQIQIVDQKNMLSVSQLDKISFERRKLERELRDLRGKLSVMERARKESRDRTSQTQLMNQALSHEYVANLKDAESELFELEEEIETLEKDKVNLIQDLDKVTREALIWQRKGMLAVELKRNLKNAQSAVGEIGKMKNEIHRMEVRREQLRRTEEKLSDDVALYVLRRETAVEKTRASAAIEKARGGVPVNTSQSSYKHKLRLIKSDVARVNKELSEAKLQMKQLLEDQERLEQEIADLTKENGQLEENVASYLRECRAVDRDKQWLLERVVRSQRLGSELQRAVKRQSLRIRKPKSQVLAEHEKARALNDRLRYIVQQLTGDYPYLEEKLEAISNTLNIFSPSMTPRLTDEGLCTEWTEEADFGCVIPEEEVVPEQPTPYCRQQKDTCVECKCTDVTPK